MSLITTTKKQDARVSTLWSTTILDCKCNYPECTTTVFDARLIPIIDVLMQRCPASVVPSSLILSGYRCKRHNAATPDSSPTSQHLITKAVDIRLVPVMSDLPYLMAHLFNYCILYSKRGFIHGDIRDGGFSWTQK